MSNFAVSIHCHRATLPWLTVRIWYVAGSAPSLLERAMLYEILSNVPEENAADLMVQCWCQFKNQSFQKRTFLLDSVSKNIKHIKALWNLYAAAILVVGNLNNAFIQSQFFPSYSCILLLLDILKQSSETWGRHSETYPFPCKETNIYIIRCESWISGC